MKKLISRSKFHELQNISWRTWLEGLHCVLVILSGKSLKLQVYVSNLHVRVPCICTAYMCPVCKILVYTSQANMRRKCYLLYNFKHNVILARCFQICLQGLKFYILDVGKPVYPGLKPPGIPPAERHPVHWTWHSRHNFFFQRNAMSLSQGQQLGQTARGKQNFNVGLLNTNFGWWI